MGDSVVEITALADINDLLDAQMLGVLVHRVGATPSILKKFVWSISHLLELCDYAVLKYYMFLNTSVSG
jgi:hypothetical protein